MAVKRVLCALNVVCVISLVANNGLRKIKVTLSDIRHDAHKIGHHQKHHHNIDITVSRLQNDKLPIKEYIINRVAHDIKRAKRWGKGMATTFGGISGYVYDAIPFEFFTHNALIDEAFNRLEEGVDYIRELKEQFKKNILGSKKKFNQSLLAEFLYGNIIDRLTITDAQKALLKKEPLRMDEFVRKGIVKRSEYMYYTLLNFVVRYYLEQELKK